MRIARHVFRNKTAVAALALVLAGVTAIHPSTASAMDKNVKTVLTTSMYGAVGGTVLGFAVFPFSTNARHIFMGASMGLYAGIAMGVYFVVVRLQGENFFFPDRSSTVSPGGKKPGRKSPKDGGGVPGSTYDAEPPVDPGYGPQFDQEAPPDTWLKRSPPYAKAHLSPAVYFPVVTFRF